MFIHSMSEGECRHALKNANVGRLACARDNQPYVVPIYFAYNRHYLYAVASFGQKIDWMRTNPLVCLEVDEVTSREEWLSVVVFGHYQELLNIPEYKLARERALELLQSRTNWWWEPAYVSEGHRDTPHSCAPIAFRIRIDRMSGLRATPDVAIRTPPEEKPVKGSWLASLFRRRRSPQAEGRILS